MPAGTVTVEVCAETGMLATDACLNITNETFSTGAEPTEACTAHPGALLHPQMVEDAPPPAPSGLRDIDRDRRERSKERHKSPIR